MPSSNDCIRRAANKANQAELESTVFIVVDWACEGFKATKAFRQPFQSAYLRRYMAKWRTACLLSYRR